MILTYEEKLDQLKSLQVYLAGPIFKQTDQEANDWRKKVINSLPRFTFLNPMDRDYRGKEDENVGDIVVQDKLDIVKSNIILANVKTPSAGTSMEVYFGWELNMPVISIVNEKVSPWIRYHSDVIVFSTEEAIAELKRIRER